MSQVVYERDCYSLRVPSEKYSLPYHEIFECGLCSSVSALKVTMCVYNTYINDDGHSNNATKQYHWLKDK